MEAADSTASMLEMLELCHASNCFVSYIAIQMKYFCTSYNNQDIVSYIDQYTSLFSQLEHMGRDAATKESQKAPMLLTFVDSKYSLESTAAAFCTK